MNFLDIITLLAEISSEINETDFTKQGKSINKKNLLFFDYPRGRASRYFAEKLILRITANS